MKCKYCNEPVIIDGYFGSNVNPYWMHKGPNKNDHYRECHSEKVNPKFGPAKCITCRTTSDFHKIFCNFVGRPYYKATINEIWMI